MLSAHFSAVRLRVTDPAFMERCLIVETVTQTVISDKATAYDTPIAPEIERSGSTYLISMSLCQYADTRQGECDVPQVQLCVVTATI